MPLVINTNCLIIATHNKGKLLEFQELLDPYVKEIISAADINLPEPEETGATFTENALIKAHAAAKASGEISLADDSGLCVTALGNKPGLHSSRWAGPEKDFTLAMHRIHDELAKIEKQAERTNSPPLAGGVRGGGAPLGGGFNPSAHFICILALAWPDGREKIIEGRCGGTITWPPRGDKGMGYDPIFVLEGHTRTFAEMDSEEKNALSHRGKALQKLVEVYFEN
jgi:XTP/dITP diphosphohydrolase